MSHLIRIYAVCKFSYFRLWYSKFYMFEIISRNYYQNAYIPVYLYFWKKIKIAKAKWLVAGLNNRTNIFVF